jgi:hypothetical protein
VHVFKLGSGQKGGGGGQGEVRAVSVGARRKMRVFPAFFLSFFYYFSWAFTKSCWCFLTLRYAESHQVVDTFDRRVSSEYDYGDVGAFERFGVFPTSDEWCEECCRAFGGFFLIFYYFCLFCGFVFCGMFSLSLCYSYPSYLFLSRTLTKHGLLFLVC